MHGADSLAAEGLRVLSRWLRIAAGGVAVPVARAAVVHGLKPRPRSHAAKAQLRCTARTPPPVPAPRPTMPQRRRREDRVGVHGRPCRRSSLSLGSGPDTTLCSAYCGSRTRSSAFRPGHGAYQQAPVTRCGSMADARDPFGRSVPPHRNPRGGQPGHREPGDLGCVVFHGTPVGPVAEAKCRRVAARRARRAIANAGAPGGAAGR